MQLFITLELGYPMELPLNYRYQLQSAIFRKLRLVGVSDFWHNQGFGDVRVFKPFVFSEFIGRHHINKERKSITYAGNIRFEIRSVDCDFIQSLYQSFKKEPTLKLFDRHILSVKLVMKDQSFASETVRFYAGTPVCVHQTDDNGKTRYFSPDEPEFSAGLIQNFKNKYTAVTNCVPPELQLSVLGPHRKLVTKYKGIWITAYHSTYEITACRDALQFIYNAGLGEKNAQGFGLLEIL